MVLENYKCEECGFIIENVEANSGEQLPKRKNCPKCETKKSCYRMWGGSFHIPTNFKAVETGRGINLMRDKMKNYKGVSGNKHYY